jgi:secondary thiamine-phosphate synthase enzyme
MAFSYFCPLLFHYSESLISVRRQESLREECGMVFSDWISFPTRGLCDILDITPQVLSSLQRSGITNGLLTVFCPGSTGALTTLEYEAGVLNDLKRTLEALVPSSGSYEHDQAWRDGNGFSHVRAALMKPSLSVPLIDGKLSLGTWQQIVFIDFDNRPRRRKIVLQIVGE